MTKKPKRQPHVWVVEIWNRERWEPCSDCVMAHEFAGEALAKWRDRNPDDRFRVAKYQRVKP